jgi:hypothetical protein
MYVLLSGAEHADETLPRTASAWRGDREGAGPLVLRQERPLVPQSKPGGAAAVARPFAAPVRCTRRGAARAATAAGTLMGRGRLAGGRPAVDARRARRADRPASLRRKGRAGISLPSSRHAKAWQGSVYQTRESLAGISLPAPRRGRRAQPLPAAPRQRPALPRPAPRLLPRAPARPGRPRPLVREEGQDVSG